jgi:hypothetical protein
MVAEILGTKALIFGAFLAAPEPYRFAYKL